MNIFDELVDSLRNHREDWDIYPYDFCKGSFSHKKYKILIEVNADRREISIIDYVSFRANHLINAIELQELLFEMVFCQPQLRNKTMSEFGVHK